MKNFFKYKQDDIGRQTSWGEMAIISVLFIITILLQKPVFVFISRSSDLNNIKFSLTWLYVFLIVLATYIGFLIFLFIKYRNTEQVKKYFINGFKASFSAVLGGYVVFFILLIPGKLIGLILTWFLGLFIKNLPGWIEYSCLMLLPFLGAGLWAGKKMKIDGYTWGIITSSFIIFILVLSDNPSRLVTGLFYELGARIYILLSIFSAIGSKIMTRPLEQKIKREKESANKKEKDVDDKPSGSGKRKSRFKKSK